MGGGRLARARDTVLRPGQTDISPHGTAMAKDTRHRLPQTDNAPLQTLKHVCGF